MRRPLLPSAAAFLLLGGSASVLAGDGSESRSVRALRVSEPPVVDGRLDDGVWARAEPAAAFVQVEPDAGSPASEATEARFLYTDEALYVGVLAQDAEPDRIVGRLTRRDLDSESDWITVEIDPFHDHRNGYRFAVNAAEVTRDSRLLLDTVENRNWDAIWQARVARIPNGWSAEFRIPFSSLRFGDQHAWGVNVLRRIPRKGETGTLAPLPPSEPGRVSRFAHLEGIRGLRPSRHLFLSAFGLARARLAPEGREGDLNGGIGFRTSGTLASLRAEVNPDFGQVEADPAVVNLSVFETTFPEKRPFFVEAASEFSTPFRLFFSRRIGRRPGLLPVPRGETVTSRPESSTIVDSMKLSGESGGLRLALLQALTADEFASVTRSETLPDGTRVTRSSRRLVEPRSNYVVGRAARPLGGGSEVGLLVTAVHRRGESPAWSGGLDWDLRSAGGGYALRGQAAFSRARTRGQRGTGAALLVEARKAAGEHVRGGLQLEAESPDFEIGDLGYLRRSDWAKGSASLDLQWTEPRGPLRQRYLTLSAWRSRNWAGLHLGSGLTASADMGFDNLWWTGATITRSGNAYDDLDTRGGPPIRTPARWDFSTYVTSDASRRVSGSLDVSAARTGEGLRELYITLSASFRPRRDVELSFGPYLSRTSDPAQWVENRYDGPGEEPTAILYGELEQRTLALTARASVSPTPSLSVELWLQPFVGSGDYGAIRQLARPRSYEFIPAELGYDPDFAYKVLRSNLVVRWEYRRGSALFLAWSQDRFDDSHPGQFRPGRDLAAAFKAPGTHVLLVKLEHLFDF